MATAVPGAALYDRTMLRRTTLLAEPGQRIELTEDTDDRMTRTIASGKCRLDAIDPLLHREATLREHLLVVRRTLKLLQTQLRMRPDVIRHTGKYILMLLDKRKGSLLLFLHDEPSFKITYIVYTKYKEMRYQRKSGPGVLRF